jgi:hypothetical protein
VYPTAIEFCNRRDDDCDAAIDEAALPAALYPDADGDGYYSYEEKAEANLVMGCVPYPGYADRSGDCQPGDAAMNPGASEVCNLYDDDCDGRADERVLPICGEGWCRRESFTCSLDNCEPGQPVDETCNFLDDDCDGEVDEGALCASGQSCLAGQCRVSSTTNQDATGDNAPDAGTVTSGSLNDQVAPSGASPPSGAGCAFGASAKTPVLAWVALASLLLRVRRRRAV